MIFIYKNKSKIKLMMSKLTTAEKKGRAEKRREKMREKLKENEKKYFDWGLRTGIIDRVPDKESERAMVLFELYSRASQAKVLVAKYGKDVKINQKELNEHYDIEATIPDGETIAIEGKFRYYNSDDWDTSDISLKKTNYEVNRDCPYPIYVMSIYFDNVARMWEMYDENAVQGDWSHKNKSSYITSYSITESKLRYPNNKTFWTITLDETNKIPTYGIE